MRDTENTIRSGEPQASRAVAMAFLLALALRALAAWYMGAGQPQEIRYITIARGIMSGQGFVGLDNRFPDIIQPPLLPLLLSAALLLPGPDLLIARGLSVLMGALLVFPGALIATRLFGLQAGRRAAFLIAAYPLLAYISCAALTESTFALLVVAAALLLWTGLRRMDEEPRVSARIRFTLAGVLLGLAYLTRPEGLTYLAVAVAVLMAWRVSRGGRPIATLRLAALPLGGFLLMAAPYLIWVHGQTGQWLLAPKVVLIQVNQTRIQDGQRAHWKEPYGSGLYFEHVKFGLNADATAISSHEKFAAVNLGFSGGGLLASDEGEVALSDPFTTLRTALRNLRELYLETIKYGFVLPTLLVMLTGVGLVSLPPAGASRRSVLLVLAFLAGGFSFLLSHVEARFLYTALPFAIPWMGEGWRRTEVWLITTISGGRQHRAALPARLTKAAAGVAIVALTGMHIYPALRRTHSLWSEHREMGVWLKENLGPGRKVMAATPVTAYYADGRFDVLPYAGLEDVVSYARFRGVEYLVADRAEVPSFRPQLTALLNPARAHEGLDLVKGLHERTQHCIFLYRVLPASLPER